MPEFVWKFEIVKTTHFYFKSNSSKNFKNTKK